MAFHVYPDPSTAPATIAAGGTLAPFPVAELLGAPVSGYKPMFLTVALSSPVLAAAPAAIAKPAISLAANGGAVTEITSVGGVGPTQIAGVDVYGSVTDEGGGVYRVDLFNYATSAITWQLTVRNKNAAEVRMTAVVADSAAAAHQAWMDVPAVLDWDTTVGASLTGQKVPLTVSVGNRGSAPLTLGVAVAQVGASNFAVKAVPAAIAPGTAGGLGLIYNAPATPGADHDVTLDLLSNDPETADPSPEHALVTTLAATRGQLEVMLLLDGSGSMASRPNGTPAVSPSDSRWEKLHVAADQFLTLLGDFGGGLGRVGVSVFPDITQANAPEASAGHLYGPKNIDKAVISDASAALNGRKPAGWTPMGTGIGFVMGDTAGSFGDFTAGDAARQYNHRTMVLMSDGAQNRGQHPNVFWRPEEGNGCADAGSAAAGRSFTDKGVRAITVAYGDPGVSAFPVDHALLSLIACKSGGTALDALADDTNAGLLKSFRGALIEGLALDPTIDPGGVFRPESPSLTRPVNVLRGDQQVSFVVDWVTVQSGRIRLELLTPAAELISSTGNPPAGVTVHSNDQYVIVTVDESFLRNDADPSHPRYGGWTMILTAEFGPVIGIAAPQIAEGGDSEQYQYAVITRSALRLRLSSGSAAYVAGDTIELAADLRLDGVPVRGASVQTYLDRPGASADNWLAAAPVTAQELAAAKAALNSPETTTIGIKAHALHLRGEHFDPLRQSGVLTMTPTQDGYALSLPGNATPGTSTLRVVAIGELDGAPFRREQQLQVRVGVRPDPAFTLVDVRYPLDRPGVAIIRVWPRDPFGNVLLVDPETDPTLDITVAGAQPLTPVETLSDGSYTRTVSLPGGTSPVVTVTAGGVTVVTGKPVPPASGLHYADRLVDLTIGAEAAPGANQHRDPAALLGDPATAPANFLALGAGGVVSVASGHHHVLAQGEDDVNVIVADTGALRSYRVQAQQLRTGSWIDLGTSSGTSASFSLHAAGLVATPAVRVIDTSGRTREADLSVSSAPGAQLAGIGFRRVGKARSGCLGQIKEFLRWLLRWLRGGR